MTQFYTFKLNSGMQFVHNLIHVFRAIRFVLDPVFITHNHAHQLLLFYHRAHSFNSLLLRSKGNVQLVMYFSEVIRANSSKTSTALNKGTLGFVKAKCITKRRPLIYKNKQTKGRCIISKFIVQTTSCNSWLQHILLILNLMTKRNVTS